MWVKNTGENPLTFSVRKGSESGKIVQEPVRLEPGEYMAVEREDYSLFSSNKRVIIINPVLGYPYQVDINAWTSESVDEFNLLINQDEQIKDLSIRLTAFFIRLMNMNLISGQPYQADIRVRIAASEDYLG